MNELQKVYKTEVLVLVTIVLILTSILLVVSTKKRNLERLEQYNKAVERGEMAIQLPKN